MMTLGYLLSLAVLVIATGRSGESHINTSLLPCVSVDSAHPKLRILSGKSNCFNQVVFISVMYYFKLWFLCRFC